jgi:hypothetical protein
MRIGLAVDSACDLPRTFRNNVVIQPIPVKIDQTVLSDERAPDATLRRHRESLTERGHQDFCMPHQCDALGRVTSAAKRRTIACMLRRKPFLDFPRGLYAYRNHG